ncbi:MAG TPA: N-acetylmuramoyl-L-alanine amidase [Niabella sp.]|nr:N-acetylmuramoyl-L-alanine amidase [Niabella sp.]
MRQIDYIVIHTTDTPLTSSVENIINYWRDVNGWIDPGYHFLVKSNGEVVDLHPIELVSNGVYGFNQNSIHISYIGGRNGVDDRTCEQKIALIKKLVELKRLFPNAQILGHRDFPGVKKTCPNFDAITEYNWI